MLLRIVRVDSMGHICGDQEGPVNGLEVRLLVELSKAAENSLGDLDGHVGVSSLGRLRTDLLVVEKDDHIDLGVLAALSRGL